MSESRSGAARRQVLLAGLLLLAPVLTLQATPPTQPPPAFPSRIGVVRIDVVVLGRDGQPVSGLTAADFTLEENGRPRTITTFQPVVVRRGASAPEATLAEPAGTEPASISPERLRAAQDGRCLLVFLDTVHLTPVSAEFVRQALRRYLDTDVQDGDWVDLVAPDRDLRWTARTPWEYRQLGKILETVQGRYLADPLRDRMSDWADVCRDEYGSDFRPCQIGAAGPAGPPREGQDEGAGATSRVVSRDTLANGAGRTLAEARRGVDATRTALLQAVESMTDLPGRKSLVLVADGFVMLPRMQGYAKLVDAARRAHVVIDFLDPRRPSSGWSAESRDMPLPFFSAPRQTQAEGSGDLVEVTGGRSFGGIDPVEALRRVARESDAYYLIGYEPADRGPTERRLRIRVGRPGLEVRARTRYFIPAPASGRGKAPPPGATEARRLPVETADTAGLPLRTAALFFDADEHGEVTTALAVEVPPTRAAGASRLLRMTTEARRVDDGRTLRDGFEERRETPSDEPVVLVRRWPLRAGVWQVRVRVEDVATGLVGTSVHMFEVPDPRAFRLSTPLLTAALEGGDVKTPRLTLERRFPPAGRLYCQFTVQGASHGPDGQPRVSDRWELRHDEGLVEAGAPEPIRLGEDCHLVRTISLSLEGLPIGDYELEILVEDRYAHASVSRTEHFTVSW